MQVTSSSAHAIRITGLSRLTFRHGFSSKIVADLTQTRRQPIQGEFCLSRQRTSLSLGSPSYLHLELQSEDDSRRADRVELVDLFGNILVSERIQANPPQSTFFSTVRPFQPPADSFFFYIRVRLSLSFCSRDTRRSLSFQLRGHDSNGHRFQRLTSTALSSYIPSKPLVHVDSNTVEIKSNVSFELQCHVQSQLPYQVQWFRNGQLVSTVDYE